MSVLDKVNQDSSSIFSINYTKGNLSPSTLGFKYPTLRDHPLKSSKLWLLGKKVDDGAEGLWRIHDGLYNFTYFINEHPGGADWLKLTKGTDITEAFESHHISTKPEGMLSKFFIRPASTPRNSPFTFQEDGFYKTLKRNTREALKTIPTWPAEKTEIFTDVLLLLYLTTAVLAAYTKSFSVGVLAGLFLSFTTIAAHNFFHKRDNLRMYYFDLSPMSSHLWRVTHVLSHHMYPNTVQDLEIAALEPFLQYLPQEKHFLFRYGSWLYSPLIYCFLFLGNWFFEITYSVWRRKGFSKAQLLPLVVPFAMFFLSGYHLLLVLQLYFWIITVASFHFGFVSLNASHHHPAAFHDGDAPRPKPDLDWGVYQLDAVMERREMKGSHFWALINFGDHSLHHLFPTLDQGVLGYLYPVLEKTCKEFGIELRMTSQLEMIRGQFMQLAKIRPNATPPRPMKKIDKKQ